MQNYTQKNAGLLQPKFGWNIKNVIKKITRESWSLVKILNYIYNPTFGFVHILPKFRLKQPSIV